MSIIRELRSPTVKAFCAHYETTDPVATVKSLASRLVKLSGQNAPPYEPTAMLSFAPMPLASRVRRVNMSDDADIRRVGTQLQIFLNAEQSELRNRFSLAHELGHTFFLPFRMGDERDTSIETTYGCQDAEEERLCNIAAAEILMPEHDIRHKIIRLLPTASLVKELAARFTVSQQSMAVRVCGLSPLPLLTGAIGTDSPHSKRGLRLFWYAKSASANVQNGAPILSSGTRLPEAITASDRPFAYALALDCGQGSCECPASLAPLSLRGHAGVLFSAIVEQKKRRPYRAQARRRRR